jgi:membrane-associated phospholipid phosphatase
MINKYWKISAHMIGVSAPMAAFLFFGSIYFIILFFLAILLAWARLKLKMHSINQIIAGFLFGFLLTYLQLIIFIG